MFWDANGCPTLFIIGKVAEAYLMPISFLVNSIISAKAKTAPTPQKPKKPAAKMLARRKRITVSRRVGTMYVAIDTTAAIKTVGELIKPPFTAVSPIIIEPTMLTVWPTSLGRRSPASRITSYSAVITSVSAKSENGVLL